MQRSRIFAWTINAREAYPTEVPTAPQLRVGVGGVAFYRYQMERGENGRLHLQGCIRFHTTKSMEQVKAVLGCPWAHIEVAHHWNDLVAYCGKEHTRVGATVEEGSPGEQGKRTDLHAVATALRGGCAVAEIAAQYPETYIKFHKGVEALHHMQHPPKHRPHLKVFLLYGQTGVGKTFFVNKYYPDHYDVADQSRPWFCGYNQEKVVLFDEYGPHMMPIDFLKKVLDVYKCKVPVKGGHVAWNPDIIFITSNHRIHEWWDPGRIGAHDLDAIARRITVIDLGPDRVANEAKIINVMHTYGIQVPGAPVPPPAQAVPAVAAASPINLSLRDTIAENDDAVHSGDDIVLRRRETPPIPMRDAGHDMDEFLAAIVNPHDYS